MYLNTSSLCIEVHPTARSTLGEPEPYSVVVGLDANFLDLEAIPGTQLGSKRVQ
jgi:hypothetical protein